MRTIKGEIFEQRSLRFELYIETAEVILDGLPGFRLYLVCNCPIIVVG
jgi:hypothetical protein